VVDGQLIRKTKAEMDASLLHSINENDIEKFRILSEIFNKASFSEAVTLRIFADEYSNLIKESRSNAYYLSVKNSLQHLTNFFGLQRPIQSIGLRDVENFVSHLQKIVSKGYRVYVRTLKAACNKAIDWGYVKENYFVKVKLPKKQKVNPAYINSNQLSIISKLIQNEIVKDVTVTAFYTGMRLNELVNLTWRNIDLTTRIITVGDESFTTKGRNQRYIPISDEVFEILLRCDKKNLKGCPSIIPINRIERKNEFVFRNKNGKKITGDYISKSFKCACKNAQIDNAIHFHSLRHSFASNLAQKGISLYTIKELLGHSSISTTEIYSHLNIDTLKEAIKKLDVNNYSTKKAE